MKIHFEANKNWIFAPKMIKAIDNIWREDSNFFRFKVNLHAEIVVFGAKIKIGEKVRISEQCAFKFRRIWFVTFVIHWVVLVPSDSRRSFRTCQICEPINLLVKCKTSAASLVFLYRGCSGTKILDFCRLITFDSLLKLKVVLFKPELKFTLKP